MDRAPNPTLVKRLRRAVDAGKLELLCRDYGLHVETLQRAALGEPIKNVTAIRISLALDDLEPPTDDDYQEMADRVGAAAERPAEEPAP